MNKIKYSHKVIAVFLTLNFLTTIFPVNYVFAGNNGPTAPEAVGFEPVDATDMVNLTNGNFTYVLPLLDVEGFPVNLSYHAGISPDMEASWVGLGWYLNPGAINRATNGTPDDWKSGIGINFTSFSETQTYHSINAGVGVLGTPVSIGVGAHWGGGQGLSGSVQANLGVVSGYADTRGNFQASVGAGALGASFSNNSKPNYSIKGIHQGKNGTGGSLGYSSDGTISAAFATKKSAIGISFNGTGSFSIGGTINGAGGGFSSSSNSENQGDATIDTKSTGLSLSIPIGPISVNLGYKRQKVKVTIRKGYKDVKWGALYSSEFNTFSNGNPRIDYLSNSSNYKDGFVDYMDRSYLLDSYSTPLPQSEEDFIGDYSKIIENTNFTFVAYDSYSVAAQGMMGSLSPRVFENATIIGRGDVTENESGDPMHIFWHHGSSNHNVQRKLANTGNQKPFEFYFNGQFTSIETNSADVYDATNLTDNLDLNHFVTEGLHNGYATGINRAHQGNFVEVYTNNEIAQGLAMGLITPKNIPNNIRDNSEHFDPDGIGGYKITAVDGKVYHYSIPVYHFERVRRNQMEGQEYRQDYQDPYIPSLDRTKFDCKNVSETRNFTRYATHWLLTAITGPDYVDRPDPNSNDDLGTFNREDYGYWVELEYGKWSDGFVWRSPYQDFVYDYNTNTKDKIGEQDKGYYQFGRKQVYYLDRINTRERSALFIKDIRYDGYGKDLTYRFMNKNGTGNTVGNSGENTDINSLRYTNPNVHVKETNVHYEREYSLRLDRIVLIDSEKNTLISKSGTSNLGSLFPNYLSNSSHSPGWQSPYFKDHYHPNSTSYDYSIHQEENILDIGDIPSGFIENNGLKTIKLNHNYQLVKNTPSSMISNNTYGGNIDAGRLTLNSIEVLGRGNSTFMPPTTFTYYDDLNIENPNFLPATDESKDGLQNYIENRETFIDSWGFMQGEYISNTGEQRSKAEIWSLKQIQVPTGGNITIDYEEDDFWTEAFSRRYWMDGLQFKIHNLTPSTFDITIKQNSDEPLLEDFNFDDYFNINELVFFDLWLAVWDRDAFSSTDRERIDIFEQGLYPYYVDQEELVFRVDRSYIIELDDQGDLIPHTFRKTTGNGSEHDPCPMPRGHWGACNDGFNLVYKLLANKVPDDQTGGGLRVKQIITSGNNDIYKATFNYNHPTKITNSGTPRSSGITSYAPVDGLKYIPYQSEIPPPGVTYEYVTMSETDASGNYNSKTRYRHHSLQPVFNIFNPNIEMEVLDSDAPEEDTLFWATVEENSGGLDGDNPKKLEAKKIDVNINSALFGQVKSIELLNSENHVINKTEHQYSNGRLLNNGHVKETFNSLKTIFESNDAGTQVIDNNTKRLLSISSKTEYKNVLKKTSTIAGGQMSSVEYSDIDPWAGSFRTSKTTMSDGTLIKTTKVPAYTRYSEMGSKVENLSNKNMLTQETMSISQISFNEGNSWNTLNANIMTWNDEWTYRDDFGNETTESGIWRKHKSFVWKDEVNPSNGQYMTLVDETSDYFNWGTGTPTNDKWQNISEVTRYTHWSSPVESRDINNNFASSKMADDFSKVIAGGNARYTEMYYSGAEYVKTANTFEGEVLGANYRTNDVAHTGEYSVKNSTANAKVFQVTGAVGTDENDVSKDFRPGKYKVSFWTHLQNGVEEGTTLKLNYSNVTVSETVEAGCWKQFNYYVDLQPNSNFDLFVTNTQGTDFYFDDFRMHPVYSSMNSYVYDHNTDELLYILDANNMATAYRYDKAGRLKTSYKEVANDDGLEGGFKIVQQYKYHYQNTNNTVTYNEDINNCITNNYSPLKLNRLARVCIPEFNPYDMKYIADVEGGSGDYKYEWQWLENAATMQYSSLIEGGQYQLVPYAAKYCDQNLFDKIWSVKVKVTDLVTGEVVESTDEYVLDGCLNYIDNPKILLGIEASLCHDKCDDSNYMFHMYPLDGTLPLPEGIAYIDNNTELTHSLDLSNGDAYFCPKIVYVESSSCESGYIQFVSVTPFYEDNPSLTYEFYLDCVSTEDLERNPLLKSGLANDPEYANPGTVIMKMDGKIMSVYNKYSQKK